MNVITTSPAGDGPARSSARAAPKSLRAHVFGAISRWAPALVFEVLELAYNLPALWRIRRILRRGDIEFVYERYAIFAFAGAHCARRAGLPLVLEVNYTSRSPLVRRRSRLFAPLARRIERSVMARATVLAAISEPIARQLTNDLGIAAARVVLTPNAANPAHFHPGVEPVREVGGTRIDGGPVVGFVGTFAPWHGLDLLVQAFAQVAARFDARLVLVGDGPERTRIEELCRSMGLQERVAFAGTVPYVELPRYVAAFTVGVMPDSNDYGSPVKVFEYMACGKPVVVPDYAPLREVVQDRMQGLIFRRKDTAALARCLAEILADRELAQAMGRHGRELIETERNWTSNARAVLRGLGRS
jgi:glycosyltransferase involved in cell wall biosynthesis